MFDFHSKNDKDECSMGGFYFIKIVRDKTYTLTKKKINNSDKERTHFSSRQTCRILLI